MRERLGTCEGAHALDASELTSLVRPALLGTPRINDALIDDARSMISRTLATWYP